MSNPNIATHPIFFKEIKSRVNRMGHVIDQLDIFIYYYKTIEDPLERLHMLSFELRQEYSLLKDACKKADLKS